MENILSILLALLHWRIVLCVISGIAISITLSNYISWFDGRYGLLIILYLFLFGLFWQDKSDMNLDLCSKAESLSNSISTIGLLIGGLLLFSILYAFLSSITGALVISVLSILGVKIYATHNKGSNK